MNGIAEIETPVVWAVVARSLFFLCAASVIVPMFIVPIGPQSYVDTPGVFLAWACSVCCVVGFMECPLRALFPKLLTLLFVIAVLWLTVYATMTCCIFHFIS